MQGLDVSHPLTIRPATAADEERIAELVFGSPSEEITVIAGGAERAARLGKALYLAGVGRNGSEEIFVAARGPEVVGALLARTDGTSFPVSLFRLPELTATVLRIYPMCQVPALIGRFLYLSAAIEFPIPDGSYYIAELHVDARARRQGIGGRLLEHAVQRAFHHGYTYVNLSTWKRNPARRLYERAGFSATDTRSTVGFEWLTGSPGRVFMQRKLR